MLIATMASVLCLMTPVQSVMAKAPSILIDGDFSDWENVPEAYLAEDSASYLSQYESLYRVRFCSDQNYIYFYAEFNNTIGENTGQVEDDTNPPYLVNIIDVFLDTDMSSTTGFQNYLWTDCGADYILEGMPREDSGMLYRFAGTTQDEWQWEELTNSGIGASPIVEIGSGVGALEGYISRDLLSVPDEAESIKIGVVTQNTSWTESGVLPEVSVDYSSGKPVYGTLLEVPLYRCETMTWSVSNLITAELNCNGNLIIRGEGAMFDYERSGIAPWADYNDEIQSVYVDEGVTSVGMYAFATMTQMVATSLPSTITSIGDYSFMGTTSLQTLVCYATTPPTIGKSTFSRTNTAIVVCVPKESVEAYQTESTWSQYFKGTIMGIEVEPQSMVVIGGDTIPIDPTVTEIDINGDGTLVYNTEENTLTLTGLEIEGDVEGTAISYEGSEPLTIVLNDESSIVADVVIASTADVYITGDGTLVAEGVVPIVGTVNANITFDGVNMTVRSVAPSQEAMRRLRKTRFGKQVDETGGPALSGFGSADFNKVDITPSDATYGPINNGGEEEEYALYTTNDEGEQEIVTEFYLTAEATGVETVRPNQPFDPTQPAYNILGLQVDASYRGIVIQNGKSFLLLGQ